MEPTTYEKNLAAKTLLLAELAAPGGVGGDELVRRLEARCAAVADVFDDFDFVFWTGATVWELLDVFATKGYVDHSGDRPRFPAEWKAGKLRLTQDGASFLESAAAEAQSVLMALEPRRERAAG